MRQRRPTKQARREAINAFLLTTDEPVNIEWADTLPQPRHVGRAEMAEVLTTLRHGGSIAPERLAEVESAARRIVGSKAPRSRFAGLATEVLAVLRERRQRQGAGQ